MLGAVGLEPAAARAAARAAGVGLVLGSRAAARIRVHGVGQHVAGRALPARARVPPGRALFGARVARRPAAAVLLLLPALAFSVAIAAAAAFGGDEIRADGDGGGVFVSRGGFLVLRLGERRRAECRGCGLPACASRVEMPSPVKSARRRARNQ